MYVVEFRQISTKINFIDDTKIFIFYNRLKEEVKDEMARYN